MMKRCTGLLLALLLACALYTPALATDNKTMMAPSSLWVDTKGNVLLTDLYQKAIWQWNVENPATRLAGHPGVSIAGEAPIGGYRDGKAEDALFQSPWAIVPYGSGWAVSDTENHVIRLLSDGKVHTLAGTGKEGFTDGTGLTAAFRRPTGLAPAPDGGLYVADTDNHVIRLIDKSGKVSTYAGASEGCADGSLQEARFLEPTGLYSADGTLYVTDSGNHRICQIKDGKVSTIAGSTEEGYTDAAATRAQFSSPQGILYHNGVLYVADTGNGAIRVISNGSVSTLCAAGSLKGGLAPVMPRALAITDDHLYVGDVFARTVFRLDLFKDSNVTSTYTDVPSDAWYAPAVAEVSRRGLMQGSGGVFSPADALTRAMFVTMLSRMHSAAFPHEIINGKATFPDVTLDFYYAKPSAWAADADLVLGEQGHFLPDRAITRAELVTLLYRYAKSIDCDMNVKGTLSNYRDGAQVPSWATDAFLWATGQSLVGTGGTLAPEQTATRAEAAQMLVRFLTLAKL